MKTAIYIEDGRLQLVLTPETDFEKSALKTLISRKVSAEIFEGAFYACAGGWTRQRHSWGGRVDNNSTDSLIIRADSSETVSGDEHA